jgi:hypothetical protein
LIRFWLLKLSQAHFEDIYANRGILNPEFLSALNPRTGPRKILFHANYVDFDDYAFDESEIPAKFDQFIFVRRINLSISNLDEPHRDNLFRFITGTGNKLKYFRIRSSVSNKEEFCELLVNVNFEIHFNTIQILI